jgi:hypothetical protein
VLSSLSGCHVITHPVRLHVRNLEEVNLIVEYYSDFLIFSVATGLPDSHCSLPRKTGISEFAGYEMTY